MKNKGSQAMFLTLYYSLKSAYEDSEVYGFSNKYESQEEYIFKLLPYDYYTRFVLNNRLSKVPLLVPLLTYLVGIWRKTDKWQGKLPEMEKVLREADAIFDASGYTLGSGWSKGGGELLLQTIRLAKRYNKKIILMPQSFGPFDWEGDNTDFLKRITAELAYCTKIYAREQEGYECLLSLGLDNVELSTDMVIREKFFPSASDIYASTSNSIAVEHPTRGSVGFIINENVFRIGDADAVLNLYVKLLDRLTENGEKVYILNTSTADTHLVKEVLNNMNDRSRVNIISGEYSSPELIDIIGRFKYVVASRYHSVVFAYRCGVPAIILGWASKYQDLAAHFQQQAYVFDIRQPGVDEILDQIDHMGTNYEKESHRIKECLETVQANSVTREAIYTLKA